MALFSYTFMIRAFWAAGFMAVIAPMLGVFLVIRRQSLLADTLSHVSLAGIALGLFLKANPTLTTLLIVIIAAALLEFLRQIYRTYEEVSTAILMSGGLATALILMNRTKDATLQVNQYLFGSIVTISWDQVKILGILFVLLILLFWLLRRPMYVLTFDEETAHVDGLPVKWMSLLFNVITGIAITMMIPIAGALLISAIMVLPAAIAMRIGKSFYAVVFISIVIGLAGMLTGLATSYYADTPPGATITMIFIGLFLVVVLIKNVWLKLSRKRKS